MRDVSTSIRQPPSHFFSPFSPHCLSSFFFVLASHVGKLRADASNWENQYAMAFDVLADKTITSLPSTAREIDSTAKTYAAVVAFLRQTGQGALLKDCDSLHAVLTEVAEPLRFALRNAVADLETYAVIAVSYDDAVKDGNRMTVWRRLFEKLDAAPSAQLCAEVRAEASASEVVSGDRLRQACAEEEKLLTACVRLKERLSALTAGADSNDPHSLEHEQAEIIETFWPFLQSGRSEPGAPAPAGLLECGVIQLVLDNLPNVQRVERQLQRAQQNSHSSNASRKPPGSNLMASRPVSLQQQSPSPSAMRESLAAAASDYLQTLAQYKLVIETLRSAYKQRRRGGDGHDEDASKLPSSYYFDASAFRLPFFLKDYAFLCYAPFSFVLHPATACPKQII